MSQRVIQRIATAQLRRNRREVRSQGWVQEVKEAMPVATGRKAVIDAVELGITALKHLWFCEIEIGRGRINREPRQLRVDGAGLGGVALGIGPPEEDVLVAQAEIQHNVPGWVLVCVGCVAREGVLVAKPL